MPERTKYTFNNALPLTTLFLTYLQNYASKEDKKE